MRVDALEQVVAASKPMDIVQAICVVERGSLIINQHATAIEGPNRDWAPTDPNAFGAKLAIRNISTDIKLVPKDATFWLDGDRVKFERGRPIDDFDAYHLERFLAVYLAHEHDICLDALARTVTQESARQAQTEAMPWPGYASSDITGWAIS